MKGLLQKVFLILLPVLAIGLATTRDSVVVFSSQTGVTEYYSYFDLMPNSNLQMLPPLAALLCIVCGLFAVVYLISGKRRNLKGIVATSFCGATLAIIPVTLREEVLVVPNVGLPLLLIVDCLLAYYMYKHSDNNGIKSKGTKLAG